MEAFHILTTQISAGPTPEIRIGTFVSYPRPCSGRSIEVPTVRVICAGHSAASVSPPYRNRTDPFNVFNLFLPLTGARLVPSVGGMFTLWGSETPKRVSFLIIPPVPPPLPPHWLVPSTRFPQPWHGLTYSRVDNVGRFETVPTTCLRHI